MANIKVLMLPHITHFRTEESGIKRVVEAYTKYLPEFGVELVHPDAESYDVKAVHAGMTGPDCTVAHLHGLYWSGDNAFTPAWEWEVNARIVEAIRHAKEVTVPSAWVAETFQRDLRYNPHIIGHGIDWQDWQHDHKTLGYVLWNKNRTGDVCSPDDFNNLARQFKTVKFLSTFGDGVDLSKTETRDMFDAIHEPGEFNNAFKLGIRRHQDMKRLVQQAGVYLSSTKETFGIGVLEAMAAGVPVLGINKGGNLDLIQHGQTGYLYEPGNYDDMAEGLAYCLQHRKILGGNARETAKALTWERSIEKLAEVYRLAMVKDPPTVSVVIPTFNKPVADVTRAYMSVWQQTLKPQEIIIVDDGSTETPYLETNIKNACSDLSTNIIKYIRQNNQGVANARNNGIASTRSKYICCLDGDDWLEPTFLEFCVQALEKDRTLGIAYTGLRWHNHTDGISAISDWPPEWNYDNQLKKQNQIPTCCVFRRKMWERLGGYRQRYAPGGAGAEDGELYLRLGAYGWAAKQVEPVATVLNANRRLRKELGHEPTREEVISTGIPSDDYNLALSSLFNYSLGGSVSGNPNYREPDWLAWHPFVKDGKHPFASYATPKRQSHPVTQYDEPEVSVIIPVGPGHERELINALDSLEAQTFRKWEAIVVDDTDTTEWFRDGKDLLKVYPYVKYLPLTLNHKTELKPRGAGFSRNRGAELARAPFLLFLDADDTLHPDAIERMLARWNETGQAVYSDYVGQAYIDETYALSLEQKSRLQSFNRETGEAIISYQAFDFDCNRALRQPQPDSLYIWNLITTLHPKAWFTEIGGFDEAMDTWEDWDYWLRMVQAGHCFTRLPEQLVRYRFYTGTRRSMAAADTTEGRQKAEAMLKYMSSKYERLEPMSCGCKDKGSNGPATIAALQMGIESMADNNFVRAKYTGNQGNHHIWGDTVFEHNPGPPARKKAGGGWAFYYGYADRGLETLVYRDDIARKPDSWQVLPEKVNQIETIIQRPGPPVPMGGMLPQPAAIARGAAAQPAITPTPLLGVAIAEGQPEETDLDLQQLPGVGAAIAERMRGAGLTTKEAILEAGLTGLTQIEGVTNTRAVAILKALEG